MPAETEIALVASKVESLHGDLHEMKQAMRDVADALIKLALIDERQSNMVASQERMLLLIDKLDARVDHLEKNEGQQNLATKYVLAAVWGAAGLLVMYVAKMLGLV